MEFIHPLISCITNKIFLTQNTLCETTSRICLCVFKTFGCQLHSLIIMVLISLRLLLRFCVSFSCIISFFSFHIGYSNFILPLFRLLTAFELTIIHFNSLHYRNDIHSNFTSAFGCLFSIFLIVIYSSAPKL